ncbi:MAG: chemotaxis-specific protein-glutamate methyltransferase CheB [Bacteriovoracaceae bacterium]|nr:chemotaxis-specific protein-glutamate methyltransferase CheB [Bacteriovoracaceae bacterium]
MNKKILVVDDSLVYRNFWKRLSKDVPGIVLIGLASDGEEGLKILKESGADIVLLDLEMPKMNGHQAIPQYLAVNPKLSIIVLTSPSLAEKSVSVLSAGAADFCLKPKGDDGHRGMMTFQDTVLEKITGLPNKRTEKLSMADQPQKVETKKFEMKALAIGSSTGGPKALIDFFTKLPVQNDMPIFVTQHMPPGFTKQLADTLKRSTSHNVSEAVEGEVVENGRVYVAAGDYHLVLKKSGKDLVIHLSQTEPENFCRPSVDTMLKSLKEHYSSQLLAIILTGMGEDGYRGCSILKSTGGHVWAQDEASSVVWGMPGKVVKEGLADQIGPVVNLAESVAKMRRIS